MKTKMYFLLTLAVAFTTGSLAVASSGGSNSGDKSILETVSVYNKEAKVLKYGFAFNANTGLAALSVVYSDGVDGDNQSDTPPGPQDTGYTPEGLSYDSGAQQVIYTDKSGSVVVCANVYGKKAYNTGKCSVTSEVIEITHREWTSYSKSLAMNIRFEVSK